VDSLAPRGDDFVVIAARPFHLLWLAAITAVGVIAAIVGLAASDSDDTASVGLLIAALIFAFIASSAVVRVADRRKRLVVEAQRRTNGHQEWADLLRRRYVDSPGEGMEYPADEIGTHYAETRRRLMLARRDLRDLKDLGAYEEAAELEEVFDDLRGFVSWAEQRR
jgi:hypothetical protein